MFPNELFGVMVNKFLVLHLFLLLLGLCFVFMACLLAVPVYSHHSHFHLWQEAVSVQRSKNLLFSARVAPTCRLMLMLLCCSLSAGQLLPQ